MHDASPKRDLPIRTDFGPNYMLRIGGAFCTLLVNIKGTLTLFSKRCKRVHIWAGDAKCQPTLPQGFALTPQKCPPPPFRLLKIVTYRNDLNPLEVSKQFILPWKVYLNPRVCNCETKYSPAFPVAATSESRGRWVSCVLKKSALTQITFSKQTNVA